MPTRRLKNRHINMFSLFHHSITEIKIIRNSIHNYYYMFSSEKYIISHYNLRNIINLEHIVSQSSRLKKSSL